jgi:hypothetical protein
MGSGRKGWFSPWRKYKEGLYEVPLLCLDLVHIFVFFSATSGLRKEKGEERGKDKNC